MKTNRALIVCLALLVCLLFSTASADVVTNTGLDKNNKEKVTIQLKWYHQFQFAGYYAALEKGFYAEEGLEVELRERVAGTSYIEDVLQDRAQYGVADAGLLLSRLKGHPLVLVAQIFQHSPLILLTLQDSGIQSVEDLAGKRVMMDANEHANMPLTTMLLNTFSGLDAVKVQPHSHNSLDLINGKTDALSSYITSQPDWFRQRNVAVNIINPRDYGIDFYGDNLFTTEKELRNHPQRVEKIRRATLKGWQYTLKHKKEIIDLILAKYNSQRHNRDHLEYEARETEKLIVRELLAIGNFDVERYQKIAKTYAQTGFVEQTNLDQNFFYQRKIVQKNVRLTPTEQLWLKDNPIIRLGNSVDWPPFGFINNNGVYSGIAADYLIAIENLLGIKFETAKLENWQATVDAARSGKVDMLDAVVPTPQRKKFLTFTKPYLSYPVVIFAQKDIPYIDNMSDLNGQRVTVIAGSALHDLLINNHPDFEIQPVENAKAGLISVETGEAAAFIGNLPTASRTIGLEGIANLKVAGETPYRYDLSFGVNENKPILASILQKALNAIPEEKKNKIHRKWMHVTFEHKVDYRRITLFIGIIIFLFIFILFWIRHRQVKKLEEEVENRKIVEEALRDREARVTAIFDTVVDGIITINTLGIIESFNPAAESMFGYEAKDVIGQNISILMPKNYQKEHDKYLNHYLQTGKAHIIGKGRELEAKCRDGSIFPMELSVGEMWIDGQQKFTGVVRDITERKKGEEALRKSVKHYNSLVGAINEGLAMIDENGIFTYANEQYCKILGCSMDEVAGAHWTNFYDERAQQIIKEQLKKRVKGSSDHYELENTRKDGKKIWINISPKPIYDEDGNVKGSMGLVQDITERKHAEKALSRAYSEMESRVKARTSELLEAKENAEVASQAKNNFLSHMSHELRTPLNAILGYAHLLQQDQTIPIDKRGKIKIIQKSAENLLVHISDILDIAKIEANKIDLFPNTVNLNKFSQYICHYFRTRAETKGIDLICTFEDGICSAVLVDEKRLQQVLLNLVGNAVKFTDQGKVVFRIESVKGLIGMPDKTCCLRFNVEDNGVGIASEDLERIYQPFEQLNPDGYNFEGTGLGLNIAQKFVELLGGELKVESKVNKGSRFWFELVLPIAEDTGALPDSHKEMPSGYEGEKRKILVVDDVMNNRMLIKDFLEDVGFNVTVAANGKEALALLKDMQPDLIITDLIMPKINGYKFLEIFGKMSECNKIPVVAMSASPGEEERALQAGFNRFLSKPTPLQHLLAIIGELIGLNWRYETNDNDAASVKNNVYNPPSIHELKNLRALVQVGKMRRIVEWANLQQEAHSEFVDFATHVKQLAEDVSDQELLDFLDQFINDENSIVS